MRRKKAVRGEVGELHLANSDGVCHSNARHKIIRKNRMQQARNALKTLGF
jgi:hypothetical protein